MAKRCPGSQAYRQARKLFGLLALLTAAPGAFADPASACREQAAIAERAAGIPEGLLLAIGKQESGRIDPRTGTILPWPWSVNRDGEAHIFDTQAEAVAYAAGVQRAGYRSLDVGCFQVNLKYHPDAFESLDIAFDPAANALYAARFLGQLHNRDGGWDSAVADYHSATAWIGAPYRDAVLAIWHGVAPSAGPSAFPTMEPTRVVMGIRIYEPAVRQNIGSVAVSYVNAGTVKIAVGGKKNAIVAWQSGHGLPTVFTPAAFGTR